MQDHPPAPGHARQRHPGTDGPAACGGAAVPSPQAWDHVRSHAVPLHLPLVPAHIRAGAASLPLAPAHVRAGAVSLPLVPPGQPGPASADRSVLRSTDLSLAYLRRRLQAVLRRIAATPRHLDCPLAHPHRAPRPPRHLSRASSHPGTEPPAAGHRGHGRPPANTPRAPRPPKIYPSQRSVPRHFHARRPLHNSSSPRKHVPYPDTRESKTRPLPGWRGGVTATTAPHLALAVRRCPVRG